MFLNKSKVKLTATVSETCSLGVYNILEKTKILTKAELCDTVQVDAFVRMKIDKEVLLQ